MPKKTILQALFEEATIGILVANQEGVIIEHNPYIEKLFGYNDLELKDKNIEELLPESFRTRHVQHRTSFHKKPAPRAMGANLELFGQKKDGTQLPIEISLSHMTFHGEPYAIAYINDVTNLVEAKKISDDISKIVEESLNEIYIFHAETLKFIQVNKGARQNMGYSLEELQQITPVDIKPDFDLDQFTQTIAPLLNGEEDKLLFETVHQRKDQTTYPVEVHLQYSRLGNQPVFVAIIININQQKNYEKHLIDYSEELEEKVKERTKQLEENRAQIELAFYKEKELSELKSRFVSMASHEFRTPLSSILSSADLISRYEKTEQQDKRMKHVQRIKSSVDNLTSILNDLLSLEKLESGKITSSIAEVDFQDFSSVLLDEVNLLTTDEQQITYKHSGKGIVKIDQHLVKNILLNLLSNAVKYSPNGTDVELSSECNDDILKIEVKDYGMGIPHEDQEHMFSRFFRATNATSIQGTGLGLTIVKRYLDLMNGSISFESKENEGTTFSVEIPQ